MTSTTEVKDAKEETKEVKDEKDDDEYLQGPMSMSEHISDKRGMHVYILGDRHSYPSCYKRDTANIIEEGTLCSCVKNDPYGYQTKTVHQWLWFQLMMMKKDVFVDFFLEAPIRNQPAGFYSADSGYLFNETFVLFRKCLSLNKAEKKECIVGQAGYPTRIHAVDVRFMEIVQKSVAVLSEQLQAANIASAVIYELMGTPARDQSLDYTSDVFAGSLRQSNDMWRAMKYVKQWYAKHSTETLMNELFKKTKIMKQLDHVSDRRIRTALLKHLKTAINNGYNHIGKVVRFYNSHLSTKPKLAAATSKVLRQFRDLNESNYTVFSSLEMSFMDVYLLARLFRTFNDAAHPTVKSAIIYVGDDHAKIYRDFLKSLPDFREVHSFTVDTNQAKTNRCIPLKGFSKPLF